MIKALNVNCLKPEWCCVKNIYRCIFTGRHFCSRLPHLASLIFCGLMISRRPNIVIPCSNTEGICIFIVSLIRGRGRYYKAKKYLLPVWTEFTQSPWLETSKSWNGLSEGQFWIRYSWMAATLLPCCIMIFRILKVGFWSVLTKLSTTYN
jgi:hypothetical protein